MEAAVLRANLVREVDLSSDLMSSDVQVRRLQELVLRLEFHNEQLRTRAGAGGRCPCAASSCRLASLAPQGDHDGCVPSGLDEVELLDLDGLGPRDDETWLYVSPKESQMKSSITPLQWCRHVLNSPEWEVIRRSLCLRLTSASCWRRTLSSPCLASPPPPLSRVAGVSPIGTPCSPLRSSELQASSPRRRQSPVGKTRTPTFIPHLTRGSSLQSRSPRPRVDSDPFPPRIEEDDSVTHSYKLLDITDVRVVARLQEERLRQDYASASFTLANRRSRSVTFPLSVRPDLEEEEEGGDEDFGPLPPQLSVSPLSHGRIFSSARDWQRSSSLRSTPPSAPARLAAGFIYQTPPSSSPGADKMRGSLPNLAGAPSNPRVPSASSLRNSQSFDSPECLTGLQSNMASPSPLHTRAQSASPSSQQQPKATAYVSPTIKGSASVPTSLSSGGNSGIPTLRKTSSFCVSASLGSILSPPAYCDKTGSHTPTGKVIQSACSLLTPPKSLSAFSNVRDRAWRDSRY
ncbi:SLAIN motif-containing protein 1-like isoform X2 [Nerophis lumbriciformis]|uniref:SLAIN motif-containing protein 1-like isoform X1 n=1 Tax=Nerophis lumbriciformis TaxID=546530 RepID=UPI002ADF3E6E|nr:SLAIN motif-containing protein 1-like isoform X1 [Nerophis lumbriciformis]XP_061841322.1 SLAIN motif-containing protein 1-like isoform X2 [Nerophis lumbriciformis]